jgi:hypothetical protein
MVLAKVWKWKPTTNASVLFRIMTTCSIVDELLRNYNKANCEYAIA